MEEYAIEEVEVRSGSASCFSVGARGVLWPVRVREVRSRSSGLFWVRSASSLSSLSRDDWFS